MKKVLFWVPVLYSVTKRAANNHIEDHIFVYADDTPPIVNGDEAEIGQQHTHLRVV